MHRFGLSSTPTAAYVPTAQAGAAAVLAMVSKDSGCFVLSCAAPSRVLILCRYILISHDRSCIWAVQQKVWLQMLHLLL
jgi:hypothetical protein